MTELDLFAPPPPCHKAKPDPQTDLHIDTFHPTVKAFYFLTDVADDEGPFVYVPGSHRLTDARFHAHLSPFAKSPNRSALQSKRGARPCQYGCKQQ